MRVSLKNLDYVNSVRATEKQLSFIREIEGTLGYEFDFNNGTKQDATKYITKHIDEYRAYIDGDYQLRSLQMEFDNG